VFNMDILDFEEEDFGGYDLIILWDVFEHLSARNAKMLLTRLRDCTVFVMIPFETEQWECYGNEYETYLQPDLSEDVMEERYPELSKVFVDWRFWFYRLN
jgi:hypothetical protein